jgi:hypothetical protein
VLRACELEHLACDADRIGREDDIEVERRAMHLAASQAMADADAMRLAASLEPYLAVGASAFVDFLGLWLDQPALLHRRADEGAEERVRLEGPGLELRVELHRDEPGMVGALDDLRQQSVRRQP